VGQGEIFGLLGPNGAGKTTTIRMILDIFRPDHGKIAVFGGPMTEDKKERIGYMPEERGLYQDIPLDRCLLYLAALKGVKKSEAASRLDSWLERFDLQNHRKKKVKELSKGMQQKAQIIGTLLHRPELVIIDEPFTSLDPVNTRIVKEMIRELRDQGATIIMSTHLMHQVEEMCSRILLINMGRNVLYGDLDVIRKRFMGRDILVCVKGDLPPLEGIQKIETHNGAAKLSLREGVDPQDVLQDLMKRNAVVEKFEIAVPSLDEIFIRAVGKAEA